MKLFSPGKPIDESDATRNAAAMPGVTRARPPMSAISRVCVRSYRIPTTRNSNPVDNP